MNALVINGPNLNMLGIREPDIYGHQTYDDLIELCRAAGEKEGFDTVDVYQSNHEGDLIDTIQQALGVYDGIVINPAAYTHTSVGILDALKAVQIPAVEVHISAVDEREGFLRAEHVVHCVVERAQVGQQLLLQIPRQEAESLSRLDRGARQNHPFDTLVPQKFQGCGDRQIGLARPRGAR